MTHYLLFYWFAMAACSGHFSNSSQSMQPVENDAFAHPKQGGMYSLIDTGTLACGEKIFDHYKHYSPLYFINETNLKWANGLGSYSDQLKEYSYFNSSKITLNSKNVGNYTITDGRINAIIPISLVKNGSRFRYFTAHFAGIFKNRDTILNWHIVPPYPKVNMRLNDNLTFYKTPHMLYFVESRELLGLDSLYMQRLLEERGR